MNVRRLAKAGFSINLLSGISDAAGKWKLSGLGAFVLRLFWGK